MKTFRRLTAVSLVLVAVAACNSGGTPATASPGASSGSGASAAPSAPGASSSLQPPTGQVVPIRAAQAKFDACMDALLTGTLAPNELSGIGVEGPDGEAMPVEWPFGYTGLLAEGKLVLLDETGKLVAKVGDEINVGGGFGNQFWHACAPVTVTKPG